VSYVLMHEYSFNLYYKCGWFYRHNCLAVTVTSMSP
jgi:hypothetical protein